MLGEEGIGSNPLILFCVDFVRMHILHDFNHSIGRVRKDGGLIFQIPSAV